MAYHELCGVVEQRLDQVKGGLLAQATAITISLLSHTERAPVQVRAAVVMREEEEASHHVN